jgi:hypothetical protein
LNVPTSDKPKGIRGRKFPLSNNGNQKPLKTLLKMPKEDKGKFFTPTPKKW